MIFFAGVENLHREIVLVLQHAGDRLAAPGHDAHAPVPLGNISRRLDDRFLKIGQRTLSADTGELGPETTSAARDHMATPAISLAPEELPAPLRVSGHSDGSG